jgi:nucleotide-binding universal stress UspA family protein
MNLLVPIDFSDVSILVVEKAGELAQDLSATIVLLYVDEPKATYVAFGSATRILGAAWPLETSKRLAKLKARLGSLADPLRAAGVSVEIVALVGFVVDEILEQADKYHADYIVMSSHGHFAAHHLFRGIVFTRIKHPLTRPLVVIPITSEGS